ncbi:MAG: uncharacterized protein PWQ67_419 [Clostridia bacterium]|jgi:uncharacterized membrane protein YfcA|nr:uncharacterized protein [Clostridia bacterium]MDN5321965.1 uncharacterized protein [Clostridia bacterium]
MFDLSWILAVAVIILASSLQAMTGFGFAILAVPMLLLVFDAKTAVGLSMIVSFFSVTTLSIKVHKSIIGHIVINLLIGALFGIPFGVYIFFNFNVKTMKILISCIVIILSIFLISGYRFKIKNSSWVERIVGSISGLMTASIGMPGPPIVLFLNNRQLPKDKFRATFACYNALVYVPSILFLFFLGAINKIIILKALTLVPFAILGGILGNNIFPLVSQAHFQKGVPLLVLITALYSVLTVI